jgi:hypothetical protein
LWKNQANQGTGEAPYRQKDLLLSPGRIWQDAGHESHRDLPLRSLGCLFGGIVFNGIE